MQRFFKLVPALGIILMFLLYLLAENEPGIGQVPPYAAFLLVTSFLCERFWYQTGLQTLSTYTFLGILTVSAATYDISLGISPDGALFSAVAMLIGTGILSSIGRSFLDYLIKTSPGEVNDSQAK